MSVNVTSKNSLHIKYSNNKQAICDVLCQSYQATNNPNSVPWCTGPLTNDSQRARQDAHGGLDGGHALQLLGSHAAVAPHIARAHRHWEGRDTQVKCLKDQTH